MRSLSALILLLLWLAGIVIAKGAWSVALAICTPWGLYLLVQRVMQIAGIA